MGRDIGNLGENYFQQLCIQEGLTCNKSVIDETGWDLYVEAPFASHINISNISQPPCKYKVQVKSTETDSRHVNVKLSSLHRLALYPGPSFIVLCHYRDGITPDNLYIMHVDKKLTERVMLTIAAENRKTEPRPINKISIKITFPASKRIPQSKSISDKVFAVISDCIGGDILAYMERKADHLRTIGYEKDAIRATFKTTSKEEIGNIIKVSLGLEEEARVRDLEVKEIRFGQEEQIIENGDAFISIPQLKPTKIGSIEFREDKYSPPISFQSELYISALASMKIQESPTYRIKSIFFDILANINTGHTNIDYTLNLETTLSTSEFLKAFLFLKIAYTKENFLIDLNYPDLSRITLNAKGAGEAFDYQEALELLKATEEIRNWFDVTHEITTDLGSIIDSERAIFNLKRIIDGSRMQDIDNTYIHYSPVDGANPDPEKMYSSTNAIQAHIGNYSFTCVFTIVGHAHRTEEKKIIIKGTRIIIDRKIVSSSPSSVSDKEIKEIKDHEQEKYFHDFNAIVNIY